LLSELVRERERERERILSARWPGGETWKPERWEVRGERKWRKKWGPGREGTWAAKVRGEAERRLEETRGEEMKPKPKRWLYILSKTASFWAFRNAQYDAPLLTFLIF
jgi:hypothetical protein